jgi:hypothetical protein
MKKLLIMLLGLFALAQGANASPPRMERMADIHNVTQELKRDAQDLLATARSPARNARGKDRHEDNRRDNSRVLRDLEALSRNAGDLDYAVDRNDAAPAATRNYYNVLEQSYKQVLISFADARVLDRPNIKSDMWRIIKNVAKLRFYYELSNGGWIGGAVRQYADRLDETANRLARETDRLRRSQDRELNDATDRFSRSALSFKNALRSDNGRIESSKDEFFRMKSAYENLESRLTYSNLPDEVVADALDAFDNFQTVSVYYVMLNPNPHYERPESAPNDGHWMHERVTEKAQQIADSTRNLVQDLKKDFDVTFGGGGKKAAVHAVTELDEQVQHFVFNLRSHRDSPRDTIEDLKLLDQKCDMAHVKLKEGGLDRYLNQITEIDHEIEELGRMYEYNRPKRR